jgi:biotin transporter BioY
MKVLFFEAYILFAAASPISVFAILLLGLVSLPVFSKEINQVFFMLWQGENKI